MAGTCVHVVNTQAEVRQGTLVHPGHTSLHACNVKSMQRSRTIGYHQVRWETENGQLVMDVAQGLDQTPETRGR